MQILVSWMLQKKNIIPNYVWVTEPDIPIIKYKYREENKDKWVAGKNFVSKNSNDILV